MSVMLGRPRSINASDCTIKTPIDCTFPIDPSKTIPTAVEFQDSHSPPSTYSAQLFYYSLAQKIHELLAAGAHRPHIKDYSFVTSLHNEIVSMIDALPPTLRPENPDKSWDIEQPRLPRQRQAIANSAYAFLMALHRPHASIHTASRIASIQAALDCLDAQEQFLKLMKPHQYRIYSLSFNTIDCGIVLSGMVLDSTNMENDLREKIEVAIGKAIERLKLMEERSPMAKSGVHILTICHDRILKRDTNNGGIASASQVQKQTGGSLQFGDRGNHASIPEPGIQPENSNGFESGQSQSIPLNDTRTDLVDFNNFDMDTSFWEEMNQMIDFDIGISMEEDLWNPNYSFPGLNLPPDDGNVPGSWYGGGGG